eukprot:SAG11_NODE_28555_length_320_cov_0.941176_1_plen_43_part_10
MISWLRGRGEDGSKSFFAAKFVAEECKSFSCPSMACFVLFRPV